MSINDANPEKGIDARTLGETLAASIRFELGTDDRGNAVLHVPATNDILIESPSGEEVDRTDLGGATIHDYREWVEQHVDATDVDWDERAF